MNRTTRTAGIVAFLASTVAACGGGGGGGNGSTDDGGSGSGSGKSTALVLSSKLVDVVANYGDYTPTASVRITAVNAPGSGLYVGATTSGTAVTGSYLAPVSSTEMDVILQFAPPLELPVGTRTSTVKVELCYDSLCQSHVKDSPAMVTVNYTVENRTSVTLATPSVTATTDISGPGVQGIAQVSVGNPPDYPLYYSLAGTPTLAQGVYSPTGAAGSVELRVSLKSPYLLPVGEHSEDVLIRACYDTSCAHEVPGSPMTLHLTYVVIQTAQPEVGKDPLPYVSRTTLGHDVADAEYSRALDAIVMVSSYPDNALYLYDSTTGTERKVALSRLPTAVSVSPDGRYAAVGHDARITHVDLESVLAGSAMTKQLDVSVEVDDIVLDGRGVAHAFPARDQWQVVHSVDVATNVETLGTGNLYAGVRGRLHPSGDYLYLADNGLSPSDIAKFDVRSGSAIRLYDSPYHGDYAMCGDVWFKEDGATIYTKCGNTFRSSTAQAEDMLYSGRLQLSSSTYYGYVIVSLSQSDATGDVLLAEQDSYGCSDFAPYERCYSHIVTYRGGELSPATSYTLPPISVGLSSYYQRAMFVFQSSDDRHRYLISRLHDSPEGTPHYFLTVIQ